MKENYFDHDADMGIIGWGQTLEESFIDGAKAVFALMTNLNAVQLSHTIEFTFHERDVELAFVTWLNSLIARAQARNLILAFFDIKHVGDEWKCLAKGEVWRAEMERGVEVKGATLTMLSVQQVDGQWQSQCVVDV